MTALLMRLRARGLTLLASAALLCAASVPTLAQTEDLVAETLVIDGLANPSRLVLAPDQSSLFVLEQVGTIRIVRDGELLSPPFLSLDVSPAGESGLLGLAFDPAFAQNGYIYVYYTSVEGEIHNRVSRFETDGDRALPDTEQVLLAMPPLNGATDHNGGQLLFGPDGRLYVGVGDNTYPPNSQALYNYSGKILRLDPDGSAPADNPFAGQEGVNPAIWAYGLRNPFSFDFHPRTGEMFVNEVGQGSWEEINRGRAGANYGWPMTEGYTDEAGIDGPLFAYPHGIEGPVNGCAITSGRFYAPQQAQFPPDYVDDYLFTDFCRNWIKRYDPVENRVYDFVETAAYGIVDLVVMPEGYLYYVAQAAPSGTGALYRLDYTPGMAPQMLRHPASLRLAAGEPAAFHCAAAGEGPLAYRWLRDGVEISGATGPTYTIEQAALSDDAGAFTCAVSNARGEAASRPALLTVLPGSRPEAIIEAPPPDYIYSAGETIAFSGLGRDADDGDLPPDGLTWEVEFHFTRFAFPFMPPQTGLRAGTFTIPDSGQTATSVFYRVILTATDSSGLSARAHVDIQPRVVSIDFQTEPPGLNVIIENNVRGTPHRMVSVAGMRRAIAAPPQTVDGVNYVFERWSDGGPAEHNYITPDADTVLTAVFRQE
mgnify:CR=1 FL=1